MGQVQTKGKYILPENKNCLLSYHTKKDLEITEKPKELIDLYYKDEKKTPLSIFIEHSFLNIGYNIDKVYFKDINNRSIDEILNDIKHGVSVKEENTHIFLTEYSMVYNSYVVRFDTIKYFLSKGKMLLACFLLDKSFLNFLECSLPDEESLTDLVCIIGYTSESILLKTTWSTQVVLIPISFIDNIQEIWDVTFTELI